MLYISEEELFAVLSERDLSDLSDNLETLEKTALLEDINGDAVGLVHGYLRGRYELPMVAPDAFIKGIVKNVMKFKLYERRDALNVPENIRKWYEVNVLGVLAQIQTGKIVLDAPLLGNASGGAGGGNQGGSGVLFSNKPSKRTGLLEW
jgi:phage gp36-like protein